MKNQTFKYLFILDFEATCDKDNKSWPNEIIEFPIVVIKTKTFEVIDEIRYYVKPTVNPILTSFCTELTGIEQETVDNAYTFEEIFPIIIDFINNFESTHGTSWTFVTCGDW